MKKLAFLAACSAMLAQAAVAQNATTVPVGAMTYTFPATTQLTSTYVSAPLTSSPVFSGTVSSVGANTMTFAGTPFTEGALSQPGAPFFLKIVSGAQAGRMVLITANTANILTLDVSDNSSQTTNINANGFTVAANDRVQVVPGDTLASFYGDNTPGNPLVLVGAASALSADTINIYNRSTGRLDIFFFSTSLGYWRTNTSTANQNNVVLYPEVSTIVNRRAGRAAISMTVVGEVPQTSPATKTAGGGQIVYTNSRFPIDIPLSSFNAPNWAKSNSALSADTLSIFNPNTGRMDVYFQRLDNTWRRVGDALTNQSATILPAGSGFVILKRGTVSNGTSYLTPSLPYSL